MLSVSLLQRYFDSGDYEKLVKSRADNGLPMPLPIQARLAHAVPATALALGRLVELTYGPTELSRQMTSLLLARQRPGGAFAGGDEAADPLATAVAVAALGAVLRDHRPDDPRIDNAYEQALLALAGMQQPDGLFAGPADHTEQDRALTSAFLLSLLLEDDRFRQSVRLADALSYFESRYHQLDRPVATLYRLAHARRPAAAIASPVVAGIAA